MYVYLLRIKIVYIKMRMEICRFTNKNTYYYYFINDIQHLIIIENQLSMSVFE